MMRRIPLIGAALLAAASVSLAQSQAPRAQSGSSQQPPPPQQQAARPLTAITRLVFVPVTVKDGHGQLVGDLTKDEFRIFADNVEQKVATFSSDAVPLSAVVLLDNDLNERVEEQVQKSLTTIAAGFGPNDEVALVRYDQFPETVADFSNDNDLLFTTLKRLELGSHNQQVISDPTTQGSYGPGPPPANGAPAGTGPPPAAGVQLHGMHRYQTQNALNDALFASGEMLKNRGRERRKIIFLISDGTNSNDNQHSFDETLRSLLTSDVSVYSISVTHSLPVGKSLVQKGAADLIKYAIDTGGDTFYSGKADDLERLYSEVTEQARNEYTLTFSPEDLAKGQDYHPIEVRVRRPGLNVESREGFYESAIGPGR